MYQFQHFHFFFEPIGFGMNTWIHRGGSIEVTRGCRERRVESYLMGTEFLSGTNKRFWKWIVVVLA